MDASDVSFLNQILSGYIFSSKRKYFTDIPERVQLGFDPDTFQMPVKAIKLSLKIDPPVIIPLRKFQERNNVASLQEKMVVNFCIWRLPNQIKPVDMKIALFYCASRSLGVKIVTKKNTTIKIKIICLASLIIHLDGMRNTNMKISTFTRLRRVIQRWFEVSTLSTGNYLITQNPAKCQKIKTILEKMNNIL